MACDDRSHHATDGMPIGCDRYTCARRGVVSAWTFAAKVGLNLARAFADVVKMTSQADDLGSPELLSESCRGIADPQQVVSERLPIRGLAIR
jgi:hypothetical protein